MRLFANWRNVGRVMLDARRRQGVTVERTRDEETGQISWLWHGPNGLVCADYFPASDPAVMTIDCNSAYIDSPKFEDAVTILRVLAALDLIPADIAYAADERYGRCEVCGRTARLWDDGPGWEPRWVHVKPMAVTGPNAHRAEVADRD